MWDRIIQLFFTGISVWELLLIFFSRIIEVSMGTLRIILISKGYRKPGVVLAFCEVLLWIFVASRVIIGINEQPLKAVVYSLGFASGVYVGSKIENRLAMGKVLIQAITNADIGIVIAQSLRSQGFGVTSVKAQGKDSEKTVLMIYAKRKGKDEIINKIKEIDPRAMVVSNDIATLQGGYISQWRRFAK